MKVGYLVVPNTAAEAVLRKRLIAQGAEEVTIDNEKHEQFHVTRRIHQCGCIAAVGRRFGECNPGNCY